MNLLYQIRYWFLRVFFNRLLKGASPVNKEGMILTFIDEFMGNSWTKPENTLLEPTNKWNICDEWWRVFHPKFPYQYNIAPIDRPGTTASFIVKYAPKTFDNNLVDGKPITVKFARSHLSTIDTFRQKYGRFECRCTLPRERGTWPAFWMWGEGWLMEIDCFECYGKGTGSSIYEQCITLHWGGGEDHHQSRPFKVKLNKNRIFHEFAIEWREDRIEIFTDGIKVYRFNNRKILDKYFNNEQWMVINHGIDHKYFMGIEYDYYSEFSVDYIRAYQFITEDPYLEKESFYPQEK